MVSPFIDAQTSITLHVIIITALIPTVLTVRAGRAVLWGSKGRFVKAPIAFIAYIVWAIIFATLIQTTIQNSISSVILQVSAENLNLANAILLFGEYILFQVLLLGKSIDSGFS